MPKALVSDRPDKYLLPLCALAALLLSTCAQHKSEGVTESVTKTGDGTVGSCLSRPVQPGEHPQCPGGSKVCLQEGAPACSMTPESRCRMVSSSGGLCECACTRPVD